MTIEIEKHNIFRDWRKAYDLVVESFNNAVILSYQLQMWTNNKKYIQWLTSWLI